MFEPNPVSAFAVPPGDSRGGSALPVFGALVAIKMSAADTAGRFTLFEETTPPGGGPPLHRHALEDEWFYIVEGDFFFEVDGEHLDAPQGTTLFAPKGSAHAFHNRGTTPGRLLILTQPGGADRFFAEISAATADMDHPDPAVLGQIFAKYNLELLGPPLQAKSAGV